MIMHLSSDLISQFVNVTNDTAKPVKETVVYGTTVVNSSGTYVKLDGSDILTPVTTVTNVEDGERVTVMIKNHTATITGNITSPSARGKDVEMSVNSLNIKIEGVGDSIDSAVDAANSAADKANSASNAANSAANAASNAVNAANDAKRYATDYLNLSNAGLELGASSLDKNVLITPTAIDFRQGDDVLASYEAEYIYLGKASRKATIDLADGVARLYNEDDTDIDYSRLVIEADHSIKLSAMHGIYQNIFWDDSMQSSSAWIHAEASVPWYETVNVDANMEFGIKNEYRNDWRGENRIKIDRTRVYLQAEQFDYDLGAYQGADLSVNIDGTIDMYADVQIRYGHLIFDMVRNIYGKDGNDNLVEAFCAQSASGNVTVGHGVYENASGNTNVYGNNLNLYTNNNVYIRGGELMLPNNMNINGANTSGTYRQLIGYNSNNNTVIGHGGYSAGVGQTNLYGNKISFGVKTAGVSYKPYHEAGDSINGEWYGSGFISSSSGKVYFTIPLAKPVIGSPSVSISSVDGLQIRIAAGGYGYGSGASAYAKPSSYAGVVALDGNYVRVTATMPNTTNITNNTPCGISASIKLTFS